MLMLILMLMLAPLSPYPVPIITHFMLPRLARNSLPTCLLASTETTRSAWACQPVASTCLTDW